MLTSFQPNFSAYHNCSPRNQRCKCAWHVSGMLLAHKQLDLNGKKEINFEINFGRKRNVNVCQMGHKYPKGFFFEFYCDTIVYFIQVLYLILILNVIRKLNSSTNSDDCIFFLQEKLNNNRTA